MNIAVSCPCCQGTGVRELSRHLMETLAAFSSAGEITPQDLHAKLPDSHRIRLTAVNNRLEDLRELGLLKRRKINGKQYAYSVVEDADYIVKRAG